MLCYVMLYVMLCYVMLCYVRPTPLNSNYASVFGCERNILKIKRTHSSELVTINIKMIRRRLAAIGRNRSVDVAGEILELGG
jgi:hypothetical protein